MPAQRGRWEVQGPTQTAARSVPRAATHTNSHGRSQGEQRRRSRQPPLCQCVPSARSRSRLCCGRFTLTRRFQWLRSAVLRSAPGSCMVVGWRSARLRRVRECLRERWRARLTVARFSPKHDFQRATGGEEIKSTADHVKSASRAFACTATAAGCLMRSLVCCSDAVKETKRHGVGRVAAVCGTNRERHGAPCFTLFCHLHLNRAPRTSEQRSFACLRRGRAQLRQLAPPSSRFRAHRGVAMRLPRYGGAARACASAQRSSRARLGARVA